MSNYRNIHFLKYVLIPLVSLSIIALISTNQTLWVTSPIHHFYIELFGAILAGILAFYYLSRTYTLNDRFSLFIGIGFLVNTLIDLLHVTISLVNMNDTLFLKYFIPQTWFAGRLFLSAMLAIAIIKYNSFSSINLNNEQRQQISLVKQNQKNNKNVLSLSVLLYLAIVTVFVSIVAISSLFVVFPFSVIDDIFIHRPYELFPLSLFLLSLYYFYKNKIYKNKDIFYTSLVISIVFDIFGQIIMSYSAHHYDTAHNMAHVLKDTGYFINIIGLALSSIHYNIKLREINDKLIQQYKKVKESEKMKEEFINIAAHELRTPIQPILGLTDILYSKNTDKENHELLEIVMRNAKRLQRLTNNVLDVTQIESKSLKLKKEKINLNVLISEVLKEYVNKEVNSRMVNIVYDFKNKDDIIVEADRDRLAEVIRNLLDNALKFTSTTTVNNNNKMIFVIVEKNKDKEQAIVRVKDTGKGIAKEVISKLFSKFTTIDSNKGTGLGLYICKNIVEALGGKIWAENNSDDRGATFSFTLPIIK
jgi:signal transduction histidine kinase